MNDEGAMARALALAAAQSGRTGDNPSVGCVIVRDGVVIGAGATGAGGRPHAEEAALREAGAGARGADVYVTLEPCARRSQGGGSCSELLRAAGVARVVIATRDPHPYAAGRGIALLQEAGIAVDIGLHEEAALEINAEFLVLWRKS